MKHLTSAQRIRIAALRAEAKRLEKLGGDPSKIRKEIDHLKEQGVEVKIALEENRRIIERFGK